MWKDGTKLKYDIFITCHDKDTNKLKYLVRSIYQNMEGWGGIYVVTPSGKTVIEDSRIRYFKDSDVLNIDKSKFKHRPNWQLQMFLKLFQNVTENEWYFTIDSDCIINRPLPVFENGNPILYKPSDNAQQYHRPYFEFQEKMLGLPREYPSTFITDTNFIHKKIVRDMLSMNNYSVKSFIEASYNEITKDCYMGEPEIWGQYVMKYYAPGFEVKTLKTAYDARIQEKPDTISWTDEDYEKKIKEMKDRDLDLFAIHSWYDEA